MIARKLVNPQADDSPYEAQLYTDLGNILPNV